MVKDRQSTTRSTFVEPQQTVVEEVDPKIIKVSPETHRELLKLGGKSETFDDIIKRLIKEHKERREVQKGT